MYAERIRRRLLDEAVAFAEPGRYWLKALYTGGEEPVESEPLALELAAPEEVDAAIWERLRRDGELAYLVHTGELHWPAGSVEAEAFAAEVRRLTADHPASPYAAEIERLLASFEQGGR